MAAAMLNMFLDGVVTPETVIVGLGKTGLSCARFLRRRGWPVTVMDTRHEPAGTAPKNPREPSSRVLA